MGIVTLKPQRATPFYSRHPWVYAGAVQAVSGDPADGDPVELHAHTGQFIAHGLYNRQSKIVTRLYSWDRDVPIDEALLRERIGRAIGLRRDTLRLDSGPQSAYRVVFSEADGLSGLVVDRYGDFLTAQFTALGLAVRRDAIARLLLELTGARGVYLRTEKGIGTLEGVSLTDGPLAGDVPPTESVIVENDLKFAVNLAEGQKTGYYLDQRDNRLAVARYAPGRRVLDAFSYSGGFGVYAARAGAAEVECVDASEAALALARRNAELNAVTLSTVKDDVFEHLEQAARAGRTFDLVVLDPPKFARNRAALPKAMQGYRRLHQFAMKLLARDGILVSCCCTGLVTHADFEDLIAQVAADARREMQILERRGPAPDHPVAAACRETGYLKCVISRLL